MNNDAILLWSLLMLLYITILVVICLCLVVYKQKRSNGAHIQNQSDRLSDHLRDRDIQLQSILRSSRDVRHYELPITDHPTASFQDQHDHQQVDLRPLPIVNSVIPSAPGLNQVDLPPSYEAPAPPSYEEAMALAWKRLSK